MRRDHPALWAGLVALLMGGATSAANAPMRAAAKPGAPAAACDVERGRRVFSACAICHSREQGKPALAAPNLHGVVGRTAGSAAGFKYSRAIRTSGRRWTREELDRFLAGPAALVPGTTMAFAGLRNPADRAAVICLLEQPAS